MARNRRDTLTVGLPAVKETPIKYSYLRSATQISISTRISQAIDIFDLYLSKEEEHLWT